ncbi:MAG TPA: choice-of-anchor Q domain-containing protein, partial [Chthoniobacterales bacterium]
GDPGSLALNRSVISGNARSGVHTASLQANDCSIVDNGGNGVIAFGGAATVANSTIARNRDGGISVFQGSVALSNSTVSQNSGHNQGGILCDTAIISHSTIVRNEGQNTVGGIYGRLSVSLSNSIVAGNIGPGPGLADISAGSASATHSLIGDAASSGEIMHGVNGNIVGNNGSGTRPLSSILNPNLADNGGPTFTHALVAGSVAINAADDGFAPLRDQRGYQRNGVSDMGAFEFGGTVPTSVVADRVVSRKNHGAAGMFDVLLPQTGPAGVECRRGSSAESGTHRLVFIFPSQMTSIDGASVTSGTGTVTAAALTENAREYVVDLAGVGNAQTITVRLTGLQDALGAQSTSLSINMALLLGDTNGDRAVNAGDAQQTRNRSGQLAGATTFRSDVGADGTINSGDLQIVRSNSGHATP